MALLFALSAAADSASAQAPTCFGSTVTILGTNDANHIRGTPHRDVIVGLGGNDVIAGDGGRDTICGGPGNDRIDGGVAEDRVVGGPGDDAIRGHRGTISSSATTQTSSPARSVRPGTTTSKWGSA